MKVLLRRKGLDELLSICRPVTNFVQHQRRGVIAVHRVLFGLTMEAGHEQSVEFLVCRRTRINERI